MGDGAGWSACVGNANSPSVVAAAAVTKTKFTVSVRGRNWSSARHVTETLEEFVAAIQRNARRLGYLEEDETVNCLQLAHGDGSEPEDLDVDATLGDVIICMGDKQLLAVVNSNKAAAAAAVPCASNGQASPIRNAIAAGINYSNTVKPPACRFPESNPSSTTTDPSRALKINTPTADSPSLPSFQDVKREYCSCRCPDLVAGASLPPRPDGKVTMAGAKAAQGASVQQHYNNSNVPVTPSPAELANMLTVPSSSHQHRMQQPSGTPTSNNRSSRLSSGANVNATVVPSSGDGVDGEHPNGRTELAFLAKRRSKTRPHGDGPLYLKWSDISIYFHLLVVDAAKKLDVCTTSLKKVCRQFGVKRWPGRKVRSYESNIRGLEHTIAVGQGAGLNELTAAYMRSAVSELQQEKDQLVHGTPAQVIRAMNSPAVSTADVYECLYSRGWRSTNRTSGLKPPTVRKNSRAAKQNGGKGLPAPKQRQQQKEGARPGSRPSSRLGTRDTVMDMEGLLQPTERETEKEPMQTGNNADATVLEEKEVATFAERSSKRAKRECRIAAEGAAAAAARQGLRSSTRAM